MWFEDEQRFEFHYFLVKWEKNEKILKDQHPYNIVVQQVGVADLIMSSERGKKIRRYGLFPLIEQNKITGNFIVIQSQKRPSKKGSSGGYKYYAYKIRHHIDDSDKNFV